ncbi:otoferlin isoform X2 [Frankliniella occidentalis]|uniref:Otoferlin isoform X2 n=1 Tax=Frankliniella occidentalis TaxID=133901 RepID=A0A9C6U2Y8_FRAOC|nr:otoferlin isoform X2 [Frankliniella occidentalis]
MSSRVHEDFLLEFYPGELEAQVPFGGFQDFLRVLPLCRGKREDLAQDADLEDEDDDLPEWDHAGKVMAQLKVVMSLRALPQPPSPGGCRAGPAGSPSRTAAPRRPPQTGARPLPVLVRVYVVRAVALPPRDANGSCDPYLVLRLGRQRRVDVDNIVKQNLNPIFGRVFEFEAEFPRDHALTVRVMDWDAAGRDDVIGETRIDLENRLFSRHNGGCGLPKRFSAKGNNSWRDSRLPSEILADLAVDHGLAAPRYEGDGVTVGDWTARASVHDEPAREHAALAALRAWPWCSLVPQHVETRSLHHPDWPGIEQGKLEMWVDVLVLGRSLLPVPPAVTLDPPGAEHWELRVVVLEAASVVGTERVLLSKDKSSDVYVKGWLSGMECDAQSTDVHFACLSGAAMWSWRMVFRFQHVWPENRVLVEEGKGLARHPPRLHLALMDFDTFTRDDLLGTLSLDLSRVPRGASFASNCSAPGASKDVRPTVNLFLARRAAGWWPALLAPGVNRPRAKGLAVREREGRNLPLCTPRGAPGCTRARPGAGQAEPGAVPDAGRGGGPRPCRRGAGGPPGAAQAPAARGGVLHAAAPSDGHVPLRMASPPRCTDPGRACRPVGDLRPLGCVLSAWPARQENRRGVAKGRVTPTRCSLSITFHYSLTLRCQVCISFTPVFIAAYFILYIICTVFTMFCF